MTELDYINSNTLYENRKDHGTMFLARIMVHADLSMLLKLDGLIDVPPQKRKAALQRIIRGEA